MYNIAKNKMSTSVKITAFTAATYEIVSHSREMIEGVQYGEGYSVMFNRCVRDPKICEWGARNAWPPCVVLGP